MESETQFVALKSCFPKYCGPTTSLIFDDWYPALRSERLQGESLVTTLLLGLPLVLGRRKTAGSLPCATAVRIAAFLSPAAGLTAKPSPANTTAGRSKPSAASAVDSVAHQPRHAGPNAHLRHRLSLRRTRRVCLGLRAAARKRKGSAGPGAAAGAGDRQVRIAASAALISPRTCHATSITASSASWIPPTGLSCISHGGGVPVTASTKKIRHFEPIEQGFRMSHMLPQATARPTNCWVSTASPSPPPSTSFCPIAAMKTFVAATSGFRASPPSRPHARISCRIDVHARLEYLLQRAAGHPDREILWRPLCTPGPGHHDPAGGGSQAQPHAHAD